MRFIGNVIEKMQRHPKRVVFPEGTEPRILQAARQFYALRMGVPILLGDQADVRVAAQDQYTEHAARIVVNNGPVTFRIGSAVGGDDIFGLETLDTGTYSMAFT